jgi:hypothetical protein
VKQGAADQTADRLSQPGRLAAGVSSSFTPPQAAREQISCPISCKPSGIVIHHHWNRIMDPEDTTASERFDIAKVVVLSGWSLNILTCLTIIGAATYMVVSGKPIDDQLKQWASTCLGFLFATFVPLVKDFISK